MKLTSFLPSWNCTNQRVFLRADLNIPLHNGQILGDRRLKATQPTLDYLIKQNAIVILATHIARPKNKDPKLTTHHLLPWFEKHGYAIIFCADLDTAYTQSQQASPGTIILLENLRFFDGEKNASIAFAQELAKLADWYIDDAFGALHRHDTSITLLPEQFEPQKRTIGFLVEKELGILTTFMDAPQHPVCIILGGGKVSDKIPLIEHLLPITDHLILCPAIVFTFAQSLEKPVGKSLVDDKVLDIARSILHKAPQENTQVHFPIDYQVADKEISGPLSFTSAEQFPSDSVGISIGPKSIQLFQSIIDTAQTTFFNGSIGFTDKPETLMGMKAILTVMANAKGTSIVAGGDSLSVLDLFDITGITHCLTGGGSTLTYLSGKPLPGLAPFKN